MKRNTGSDHLDTDSFVPKKYHTLPLKSGNLYILFTTYCKSSSIFYFFYVEIKVIGIFTVFF